MKVRSLIRRLRLASYWIPVAGSVLDGITIGGYAVWVPGIMWQSVAMRRGASSSLKGRNRVAARFGLVR